MLPQANWQPAQPGTQSRVRSSDDLVREDRASEVEADKTVKVVTLGVGGGGPGSSQAGRTRAPSPPGPLLPSIYASLPRRHLIPDQHSTLPEGWEYTYQQKRESQFYQFFG